MYSQAAFYFEITTAHAPGCGWDASATFSRRKDYRKHAKVTKTRFKTHISFMTREAALNDAIKWARAFIESSADIIESSLCLQETLPIYPNSLSL